MNVITEPSFIHKYSVMQSDGNSFSGDVVLTWYTVMKMAFKTRNMKSEFFKDNYY